MKLRNVVMALCLCVMPLANHSGQRFDCSHTESFAEQAVCADDELSHGRRSCRRIPYRGGKLPPFRALLIKATWR